MPVLARVSSHPYFYRILQKEGYKGAYTKKEGEHPLGYSPSS